MTIETLVDPSKPISRDLYLKVVHAALLAHNYRFGREAVLKWLVSFPGDLEAGLYYAQALVGEKRFQQAIAILEGLCMADPEFTEAVETLLWADTLATSAQPVAVEGQMGAPEGVGRQDVPEQAVHTHIFALTGQLSGTQTLSPWGSQLWQARRALEKGDLATAEGMIRQALADELPFPLAQALHLRFLAAKPEMDPEMKRALAERYQRRWPDCLACTLYLADWSMENGKADQAVALLHQVAARDISGQVAVRLWGESHPYQSLWPENLELPLNMQVPADVAGLLGWNRLAEGADIEAKQSSAIPQSHQPVETPIAAAPAPKPGIQHIKETEPAAPASPMEHTQPTRLAQSRAGEAGKGKLAGSQPEQAGESAQAERKPPEPVRARPEDLRVIGEEFERLAAHLKLPGITHLDGRFPVYVVFSSRIKLESVYGAKAAAALEVELQSLAKAVKGRRGWDAQVFFADDPLCTRPLGIKPARSGDPWEFKLALADLDNFLAKRGERIGALLIVGGPEILPFHRLPNPVDDQDADVLSDNPYASCDKNYFVPEWPVGRLPGGAGKDPQLLLACLQKIRARHESMAWQKDWSKRWLEWMDRWLKSLRAWQRPSFGYTAEVWRQAASAVFQPIGKPDALHVSPPLGIYPQTAKEKADDCVPPPSGILGYFNLHGVEDAAEWFGQRDPWQTPKLPPGEATAEASAPDGSDYPVALRPADIGRCGKASTGGLPQVVFSEACYGSNILNKAQDEAISLKFLAEGCQAVVGSTGMAYGSLGAPLVAADLLGHSFWRFIKQGLPAGEALRQAKIAMAGEMDRRQGYLDGEDQKALISFLLYGDPLAQPVRGERQPKSVRYLVKPLADIKTVCDRVDVVDASQPIPAEVMASVRQVVARCLPGMKDARLAYAQEREHCEGDGHACPTSQLESSGSSKRELAPSGEAKCKDGPTLKHSGGSRSLVTLSKQVERKEGTLPLYARLTLDEKGRLVKLVVSR